MLNGIYHRPQGGVKMGIERGAAGSWRYHVRDGKVFCPARNADVDVKNCSACIYLESDPETGSVTCLPPQGMTLSEMIEAVARY